METEKKTAPAKTETPAAPPVGAKPETKADDSAKISESDFPVLTPQPSLIERVRHFWAEVTLALISPDHPTRRMAVLFFLSIAGLALVSGEAVVRMKQVYKRRAHEAAIARLEAEKLRKAASEGGWEVKLKETTLDLGHFLVESKSKDRPKLSAQLGITVRCSDKEVREYIEARMVQARNEINSALIDTRRQDLLTPDGKRMINKRMIHHLNEWLAHEYASARVTELFFTDLTVE